MPSLPERRPLLTNLALGLVYLAMGYGTLAMGETGGVELRRLVWTGSGVALSVGLLVSFPVWPGVVLGGFAVTVLSGDPLPHGVLTGIANGLEIGLPIWALGRLGFDRALARVQDVLLLVFVAAGAGALLSALLSVTSLVVGGLAPPSSFGPITLRWWATHGVGMLLIAPPVLALRSGTPTDRAYRLELAGVLAALVVTGGLSFLAEPGSLAARLFFLSFPFLVWCAVRLGVTGAALGGSLVTALVLCGAEAGRGPLVAPSDSRTLLLTWTFANAVILTTLLAGALLAQANRARRALLTEKRRLEAVLRTTRDAILVSGPEQDVLAANPGMRRLLGTDEDLLGEATDQVLERLRRRLDPERPAPHRLLSVRPGLDEGEGTLALADGTRWEVHTAPIRSEELLGRIWSFHDLTARLDAEAESRRLQRQVLRGQKLEGLGLLAGGVAQDFKELLSAIRGCTDRLATEAGPDSVLVEADRLRDATAAAEDLCEQMLAYAGRVDLSREVVDLATWVQEVRDALLPTVGPDVVLTTEVPDGSVVIEADEGRLRQLLTHLVANASEAVSGMTTPGRIRVRVGTIHVGAAWLAQALGTDGLQPGRHALLEVQDNGEGMDPDTTSRIFEPFYSSKGSGRGLGLPAAFGLVRSHGGAIRLDTVPGRGTRFRLVFPLADASAPEGSGLDQGAGTKENQG